MHFQRLGVVAVLVIASACGPAEGFSEQPVAPALSDAEAKPLLPESERDIALGADGPAVGVPERRLAAKPNGRLDDAAAGLLTTDRCSHPDGFDDGVSLKFNDHGGQKRSGNVTWRLVQPPSNLTRESVEGAIGRAFATWQAQQSDLTFQKVTTGGTITITFDRLDNNTYGYCQNPNQGNSCVLNTKRTWSVSTPTPGGDVNIADVEAVMLHEVGHAIGIAHSGMCVQAEWPLEPTLCMQQSSFGHATMFPNFHADSNHRTLATYDDYASVSALYDQFETMNGLAQDVAAANRSFGGAWKIGTTASGSDFKVESFNENTKAWTVDSTMVGKRIAVTPDNVPWVVKANGEIWTKSGSSWVKKTGCANDIGIGDVNGTVSIWIIGCTASSGGMRVEKWNGSSFDVDPSGGAGVRIAVGRHSHLVSTPDIVPWVVASDGTIWRRYRANITSSIGWEQLPNPPGTVGRDIAVCGSGFNFGWVIGTDDRLYAWREQPNNSTATSVKGWFSMGNKTSGTRAVACGGSRNIAWTVASNGVTTRTKR
jgi:hypothetical protein